MPILDLEFQFILNQFQNKNFIVSNHLSKIQNLTTCIKWKIQFIFENSDLFSNKYTFNTPFKWIQVLETWLTIIFSYLRLLSQFRGILAHSATVTDRGNLVVSVCVADKVASCRSSSVQWRLHKAFWLATKVQQSRWATCKKWKSWSVS